jgi:quercetin dioxygenase-like cupin family protein
LSEVVKAQKAATPEMRSKVFMLEQRMKEGEKEGRFDLYELPVKHHFSQGVYGREMFIPKGTIVTGHIHKYTQLNVLVSGDLSVLTEEGVKRVKPPFVVVSPPGTKRVAYAHEDSIWLTVHSVGDETDIEKIESKFIAKNETEYLEFVDKQKQLESKP